MKHPAKFSKQLMPVFAEVLEGCHMVLDPFAGTGKIHELQQFGFDTIGVEIEPEWANMHPDTRIGNALNLQFPAQFFDAICTSPTYGNRMADHHNAKDGSVRRTYKHDLGHDLDPDNSGAMQWGDEYRSFHVAAWMECYRVLKNDGRFVLNIKDHIRKGERQFVAGWHITALCRIGFTLQYSVPVETPGMKYGENRDMRTPHEEVFVLTKSNGGN